MGELFELVFAQIEIVKLFTQFVGLSVAKALYLCRILNQHVLQSVMSRVSNALGERSSSLRA